MDEKVKLYLVRHGRPDANFGEAHDPGLDATGRAQAEAIAHELAPLGPLPIVSSPLRRTRETAQPLESRWQGQARVDERVGEIPSPTLDLQARGRWVREILRQRWSELSDFYKTWRDTVVAALLERQTSTVLITHFVAINVAVGVATGEARIVCFEPDYCSCTILEVRQRQLHVLTLGKERATRIF